MAERLKIEGIIKKAFKEEEATNNELWTELNEHEIYMFKRGFKLGYKHQEAEIKELKESLLEEVNKVISSDKQIKELKELLKIARCPNVGCYNGSIAHGDNEKGFEQEQCQFCEERKQALKK